MHALLWCGERAICNTVAVKLKIATISAVANFLRKFTREKKGGIKRGWGRRSNSVCVRVIVTILSFLDIIPFFLQS